MRLRKLILTVAGIASVVILRGRLGRAATLATGTWVGRP